MKKIILSILLAAATTAFAGEAELLATLKSGTASRFDKSEACRQLAICATKASVPTLAALLPDPDLSHMARYALEPLQDPSVDEAFRDALGKTTDRCRIGVIHSIGVRRDAKAVPALIALLPDPFAASALARIGTPDAIAAIEKGLPATAAACLIAAGTKPELYEKLTAASIPVPIRIGATAGAIQARGAAGIPALVQLLRNDDPAMFGVALRLTREWNEPKVTAALGAEVGKLAADRQELLIRALGDRGDRAIVPALLAIRTAASIQTLTQLRETSAVPMFVELVLGGRELAPVAQAALVSLPGKEADDAALALLGNADAKIRALGVSLVGQRRIAGSVPTLLKAAGDSDAAVRTAAVRAAGELATAKEFPLLVDLLLKSKASADADAAESAITAVCIREAKPEMSDALCAALPQAAGPSKIALLRALRSAGGAKALAAIRTAAADKDAEIRDTALRSMCEWPTPEALPELVNLAKTSSDAKFKILALRGWLRLAPQQEGSVEKKAASLKEAAALVTRDEERQTLLSSLGQVPSAESLTLASSFLATPRLKETACVTCVAIAEKIVDSQPAAVVAALSQAEPKNQRLANRAKQLLAQAKKAAPKK